MSCAHARRTVVCARVADAHARARAQRAINNELVCKGLGELESNIIRDLLIKPHGAATVAVLQGEKHTNEKTWSKHFDDPANPIYSKCGRRVSHRLLCN